MLTSECGLVVFGVESMDVALDHGGLAHPWITDDQHLVRVVHALGLGLHEALNVLYRGRAGLRLCHGRVWGRVTGVPRLRDGKAATATPPRPGRPPTPAESRGGCPAALALLLLVVGVPGRARKQAA